MTERLEDEAELERLAEFGGVAAELLHDLASGVAVLSGHAELLAARAGEEAGSETMALLAHCRQLEAMLRDTNESIAGRSPAPSIRFTPAERVRAVVEQHAGVGFTVEVVVVDRLGPRTALAGRASFFDRAIGNLLRNALRHANSRITITLSDAARDGRSGVAVEVADDGQGIAPELLGRLFERFAHGGHGGTGLGLASAHAAARHLGGELRLLSGRPGARFEIWLPCPDPAVAPTVVSVGDAVLSGASILLVDNDVTLRDVTARLLRRRGAEVEQMDPQTFLSESALTLAIRDSAVDLVLLDHHLGRGFSGLRVLALLRRLAPATADRTAILSGAYADDEIPAGTRWLLKPFEVEEVRALLEGSGTATLTSPDVRPPRP